MKPAIVVFGNGLKKNNKKEEDPDGFEPAG
jgi:hypothetical protein